MASSDHDSDQSTRTEEPSPSATSKRDLPKQLAHYRILDILGEGGFGVVYLAEQTEPVRRRVALKVIKPGMDTRAVVARFEAERQALALMDHPCIARVFESGETNEGRPYFAMELVNGLPITEHCDKQRWSLVERIDLFVRVCEAVRHAHAKGVIHRDIKPSNILVEYEDQKSTPKVIDFGVAKALNQRLTEQTIFTEQGHLIGTPEYMSPEQAELSAQDIDTRSDVYSLGVILYELLTGSRPFETDTLRKVGLAEIQRIIREVEPPRPSTKLSTLLQTPDKTDTASRIAQARSADPRSLSRSLRRDLDWVVMKCLEKDRERRYETANALAMELRRYLGHEPVLAGPPSVGYRLGKFARRNRPAVIAAGAIAAVLVAATMVSLGFAVIAGRERADAESARQAAAERAEELQRVADFQAEQLAIDVPLMGLNLRGTLLDAAAEDRRDRIEADLDGINFTSVARQALRDNIVERTIRATDEQFNDQPLVQAQLLQAVADTTLALGLLDLAEDPQERALEIRRRVRGDDEPETLDSIYKSGILLEVQSRLDEAESYHREALDARRRVLGDDHPDTLKSIEALGAVLEAQGRYAEGEPYLREAVEESRRVLGDEHPDTLGSIRSLGILLEKQGRFAEAESSYRQVLETRRRVQGDDAPATLEAISSLGLLLEKQGRYDEAEPYLREALEQRRRVLGDEHPATLKAVNNMGLLFRKWDRLDDAEPFYREALEARRRTLGNDHQNTLNSINNMGVLLQHQGKLAEAETHFREALDGRRRVLGEDHPATLISMSTMQMVIHEQGHLGEADSLGAETVDRARRTLPEGHWHVGLYLDRHGRTLIKLERFSAAEAKLLEAYAMLAETLGPEHEHTSRVVRRLTTLYKAWDSAEPDAGYDSRAEEWRGKL